MNTVKISDLSVGDEFQFGKINGEPVIWLVGEHNHKLSPPDTVTVVTKGTLGNITFAPANPVDKIKERRLYGNNRYQDSYVRVYINSDEFLHAVFTEEETAAIVETGIDTLIPKIDGGGIGPSVDRLFLLSASEVGLVENDPEGSVIELFKNEKFRIARDIKGYSGCWWLRSAVLSEFSHVRSVLIDGTLDHYNAYNGDFSLRPACNLKSDYQVFVTGAQK
jgi:hypothetical protein